MDAYVRITDLASSKKRLGMLPMSAATIWRKVADGSFPEPIKLGPKTTVWNVEEINEWLEEKKQERKSSKC